MSKIIDAKSISKLATKHGEDPFCLRDSAAIALAGLAYFNAAELSLIKVKDVITERNGIVHDGVLPRELSSTDKTRYFFIGDDTYLYEIIDKYMKWRKQHKLGCLDRDLYCGLDPESYFF